MSDTRQDPTPYIAMKDAGASVEEVFLKARADGYKNFECIALVCGVFDMPLHEARNIAHKLHQANPGK